MQSGYTKKIVLFGTCHCYLLIQRSKYFIRQLLDALLSQTRIGQSTKSILVKDSTPVILMIDLQLLLLSRRLIYYQVKVICTLSIVQNEEK